MKTDNALETPELDASRIEASIERLATYISEPVSDTDRLLVALKGLKDAKQRLESAMDRIDRVLKQIGESR